MGAAQFGPYALVVNTGSTPSSTLGESSTLSYRAFNELETDPGSSSDTSFFGDLGINGYYSESKRGYVSGTASGVDSEYASLMTIGWESSHQQCTSALPPLLVELVLIRLLSQIGFGLNRAASSNHPP